MDLDKIHSFYQSSAQDNFLQYTINRKLEIWMTITSTWEIFQIGRIELVLIPKFNSQSPFWDLVVVSMSYAPQYFEK